jgi:hypothetical protein
MSLTKFLRLMKSCVTPQGNHSVHGHRVAWGFLTVLGTTLDMRATRRPMATISLLPLLMMVHRNVREKRMLRPQQQEALHRSPLLT